MPELSDKVKKRIKEQSQEILMRFGKSLESVKIPKKEEAIMEKGLREEGAGKLPSDDFRNAIFSNAPNKSGDFILAEKKKW